MLCQVDLQWFAIPPLQDCLPVLADLFKAPAAAGTIIVSTFRTRLTIGAISEMLVSSRRAITASSWCYRVPKNLPCILFIAHLSIYCAMCVMLEELLAYQVDLWISKQTVADRCQERPLNKPFVLTSKGLLTFSGVLTRFQLLTHRFSF
jgi:hypothetical protein